MFAGMSVSQPTTFCTSAGNFAGFAVSTMTAGVLPSASCAFLCRSDVPRSNRIVTRIQKFPRHFFQRGDPRGMFVEAGDARVFLAVGGEKLLENGIASVKNNASGVPRCRIRRGVRREAVFAAWGNQTPNALTASLIRVRSRPFAVFSSAWVRPKN
jgi:hypothetical protein